MNTRGTQKYEVTLRVQKEQNVNFSHLQKLLKIKKQIPLLSFLPRIIWYSQVTSQCETAKLLASSQTYIQKQASLKWIK